MSNYFLIKNARNHVGYGVSLAQGDEGGIGEILLLNTFKYEESQKAFIYDLQKMTDWKLYDWIGNLIPYEIVLGWGPQEAAQE